MAGLLLAGLLPKSACQAECWQVTFRRMCSQGFVLSFEFNRTDLYVAKIVHDYCLNSYYVISDIFILTSDSSDTCFS